MKVTKRRKEQEGMYEKNRFYESKEAIELVKKLAISKFDESIEVHIKLGVNPKHADQQVRSTCVLPEGTGKKVRIAVFAKGEKAREAEEYKADIVGDDDLVEKIKKGFLDFDVCIATPDMMKSVGQIGKILGPRGLMPNPKSGTVTFEIGKAINEIRSGKIEYRCDEYGIVHTAIGKVSFDNEKIYKNFVTFVDSVLKARPSSAKGQYIKTITITSTMSPGIKIDPKSIKKALE
ncbi:TPA: 50S ribosomal protein L1 [bacterium]|nr:50S ribosomal protein L1 [bacterium]